MKRSRTVAALVLVFAVFLLIGRQWLAALPPVPGPAAERAQNIILFLGDGMGLSTINAASIYGHQRSAALFIQSLPHIGLSDTSSSDSWVTDSAAGMTAIMTGIKTGNGVISQGPQAVRGKEDGPPLKTLLEYAEERGLATGLVTNDEITGATPAACYAHVNDRRKKEEIAVQLLAPRFGDGVDVLVGVGLGSFRGRLDGRDVITELHARGYRYVETPDQLQALEPAKNAPAKNGKVLALFAGLYDPEPVVEKVISILSRNPRGYFLMVEWNSHQSDARVTLDNTLRLDRTAKRARSMTDPKTTLLLVTADHSFDLRLPRARIGEDIVANVKVGGSHTAEEVMITADGPGADRIRGFLHNTDIFHAMKSAFGW